MLIFLAGLQNISQALYDAAKVDGANRAQQFRFITIPGLRRPFAFLCILQVIASFQIFGQVDVMTGGGPAGNTRTIVYNIWETTFLVLPGRLWNGDGGDHVRRSVGDLDLSSWWLFRDQGVGELAMTVVGAEFQRKSGSR